MSHIRRALTAIFAAVALTAVPTAASSATQPGAPYTISIGTTGAYAHPTDTPASGFVDKDGTFYFQQSASLYGATDVREWEFYTGGNFDTAVKSIKISNAVNPANSNDRNNDTTWRCNNSPTGLNATYAPTGSGYAQKNYCDLLGVWVDPDTGDWYGLVHNEFTPEPFGAYSFSHFDAIDYAVSKDQGMTWTIAGHAITSPYSTSRGDTVAFPQQTFDYGDGDQRLFVDTASGYFYVYYGSRIVPKAGAGGNMAGLQHVARAPISSKMAAGSWQKWYNGSWSQPGVGGMESDMVPATSANPNGYTPPASDYNPANTGNADQQIAAGQLPATSDLFVMNIAYDAYLGLYIGEPAVTAATGPQKFFATNNLATQKWHLIGDSGSYTSGSWYRWFLDSANNTNSTIVGKSFRSYCSIACANSDGEFANVTIDSTSPAPPPVDPTKTYAIGTGSGRVLAQAATGSATTSVASATGSPWEAWTFTATGDGAYRITNAATGQILGVGTGATATRAWGTRPTATTLGPGGPSIGQQWFLIAGTTASGAPDGTHRLVNRYSGLALALGSDTARLAETTPTRSWTNNTGNPVGGTRSAAEQQLALTVNGSAVGGVPTRIPQSSMSVTHVDSAETTAENGVGANVLDGNTASNWVTQWSTATAPQPHEIQLDLGRSYSVTDLYYLPRQDNVNGRIANYQLYTSSDGTNWGSPVAAGTFPNSTAEQDVHLPPTSARYVRLVALSEVNGNPWTAIAEINVAGS